MNFEHYQKLLDFSNKLDPMELNFPEQVINNLKEYFGFSKVILNVFTNKEHSFFGIPTAAQENQQNEVVFLKNEKLQCIGLLMIYYDTNSDLYTKDEILLREIRKITEKALEIHLRFYKLKVNYSMLQNMISKLPVAVILCDSNFHILHINQAAVKILKLFNKNVSKNVAEEIIKRKILPNYRVTGTKEYTIQLAGYSLQVTIRNQIIHNIENDTYSTCYQITINCNSNEIETKWNEFLVSKELTKREQEISNLMRLGLTNDEIASDLNISVNTMKRHRESIYKKLNINRINQLNVLFENNIGKE